MSIEKLVKSHVKSFAEDYWKEDMLDQALKEAVNPGLPTTQTLEKEDSLLHDN